MFTNWLVLTILICATIYLIVMLFYYKTLLNKEKTSKDFIKNNLDDTEIVIRKLQIQLQRSLGNIDILTEELNKIKADLTSLRTRNSQYRLENDKLRQRIKELEAKMRHYYDKTNTRRTKIPA
ncbi:membrane protein [Campylobacter jejuni]|nr:membrane protein [Campylobacter jejuni]